MFAGRLVQIQGVDAAYWRSKAAGEKLVTQPLAAMRGTIYGGDGQILAMTVETYLVWADPPQIPAAKKPVVAQQLSGPLKMPAQQILNLLLHPTSPQYVVLEKNVAAAPGNQISALNITGVYETPSYARAYPDGPATSDVVGFTNVNNQTGVISGQAGIELEYNKLLSGIAGSEQMMVGANAQPIPLAGQQGHPGPGRHRHPADDHPRAPARGRAGL